jgi:PRC-barrel domain protein
MPNLTPIHLLGAAALLSLSTLAAAQQTPAPDPSPAAEKPPMAKPESAPQNAPTPMPQKPATPPSSSQAKPVHPLMGLTAVSTDGSKIGDVRAVKTNLDGKVTALHIHSGGFLGFGGKIVEIPEGKFIPKGNNIQLTFTAEEVSKLPPVKDGN